MRISLLLKREPFGKILERTLTRFLKERYGESHKVKWRNGYLKSKLYQKEQIWYCNPYINALFIPEVRKRTLTPVMLEFSRSTRWWLRPCQKAYVTLAINHLTSKWFSSAALTICPPLNHAKNLLIIGGNHHIRLLDYNEKCAFVIDKSGFNKAFFINDIKVRMENIYLPAPGIQRVADDNTWYSEDLISGTPINRLQRQSSVKNAVDNVTSSLFKLYRKTAKEIETKGYVEELGQSIEGHLHHAKIPSSMKKDLNNDFYQLKNIVKRLIKFGHKRIITCQTHGDFQPANILIEKGRSWLIDWEYSSRRQIAYDGLVYSLASRFPMGLGNRIGQALDESSNDCDFLIDTWPQIEWQDKIQKRVMIALFLLEELDLKLRENINSLLSNFDHGFKVFMNEINISLRFLDWDE
jgi:hypothetical protein